MLLYTSFPEWLTPEIIPGLPLRWYGLTYIVAFSTAFALFIYQLMKHPAGLRKGPLLFAFFFGFWASLFGAHLGYLIFFDRTNLILRAPWSIILPFDEHGVFRGYEGMNWYGGIIGAAAVVLPFLKAKKQDLLEAADLFFLCIPFAQAIGRLGNFINGELYGRLTTAPWGMVFGGQYSSVPARHPEVRRIAAETGIAIGDGPRVDLPRHPTQLYGMLLEGLLIGILLWFVFRNRKPFKGFLTGLYFALYGLIRFILDYLREPLRGEFLLKWGPQDNPPYLLLSPFNISLDQVWSLALLILGIVILLVSARRSKKRALDLPARPEDLPGVSE